MKNIIKSQFYQYSKNRLLKIIFVIFCLFIVAITFFIKLELDINNKGVADPDDMVKFTGDYCFTMIFPRYFMLSLLFLMVVACTLFSEDFKDKTENYEILSGHLRSHLYFGRVIPTIITALLSWAILAYTPITVMTIINGWGTDLPFSETLLRLVLLIFPIIRIISDLILVTIITRNSIISMSLGYIALILISNVNFTDSFTTLFNGMGNIFMLLSCEVMATYGLTTEVNLIYDISTSPLEIWGTIIVSLLFSAAEIWIGYIFFKKEDIN